MGRVGSCQPILNEGTIYARWGYQADPYYLVAMDASSRKIHWTLVTGSSDARKKYPVGKSCFSERLALKAPRLVGLLRMAQVRCVCE